MLICRFSSARGPDQLMAPVARVRIVQGEIYANEEQKAASVYRDGLWQFRGHVYARMSVEGPLVATLRDTGGEVHTASYRKMWIADGMLQAPSGTVATLDREKLVWRDAATGREAAELRLELRARGGRTGIR